MTAPFHIDGFAGGGGASEGYYLATGRHADVACNHELEATAMHRANHPFTEHHCEDIRKVLWKGISGGRQVTSAWFSPDCKDFSKAKGGKPKSKRIRGLAWTVVHMVNELGPLAPTVIFMENVEEFADWCPLDRSGCRKKHLRGWFFRCFVGALRRRGYTVESRELRASEYSSSPTIRKRLYLIARRDGMQILWPERRTERPRVAADILDFGLPCPSIFMTRREARRFGRRTGIKLQRPLARASLARVAKGVERYVMRAKEPFLVALTHQGNDGVDAIGRPLRTVTGANRGEVGLVAPLLAYGQHGGRCRDALAPVQTVTASAKDSNGVVAVHVAKFRGPPATHFPAKAASEPLGTVSAGGGHHGLVSAIMVPRYGERRGQRPRSRPLTQPVGAVTPTSNEGSLATVFLAQNNAGNNTNPGHSCAEPVSTVNARGGNQGVVACGLAKYYGTEQDPQLAAPVHSVTTKDRFALFAAELGVPVLTPELAESARAVARFLRRHGVAVEGEFAMCGEFVIVDIGMRMLTARELYRAQGFGDDYIIDRGFLEDGREIRLTKTSQIRMCGNSVCPPMAEALFRRNLPKEHLLKEAA